MDQLAQHVLEHSSLEDALHKLCKQGVKQKYGRSLEGLDQLAAQLRHRRRQLLDRYNLQPLLDELSRQVHSLVQRELEAIRQQVAAEEESFNQELESFLEQADDTVRRLEQMRSGERRATVQACARLEKKFEELFLQKHNLAAEARELRNQESMRLASLQQVPKSPGRALQKLKGYQPIEPSVRTELNSLCELADQFAALERAQAGPGFSGTELVGMNEALGLVNRVLDMERLESKLRRGTLSTDDESLVAEMLGHDAYASLKIIEELREALLQAGYLHGDHDCLKLSPRAIRRIGQKALADIFSNLDKSHFGGHETAQRGPGQPHTIDTKAYGFGDSFNVHLSRTLMNALLRDASRIPISISPDDFEVYNERRTIECSNVLMLDLSYTMAQNRKLKAAKKVVLALDNLIRTRFPRDTLHIVGFATYARQLTSDELPHVSLTLGNPFTNMQDGLRLSEKLISRDRGRNRQIIIITDGEPTAFCRDGDLYVDYPPTPEIFLETMKEVTRLTRKGIVINTFMLDDSPLLVEFVEQMTRTNKGRAFYSAPHKLGEYLLVDYLARRRRLIN
jgi:uncharacterized protein with von Willebrand factor type A (vWA) domain